MNIRQAYSLYQKMMAFPHLIGAIRTIFLGILAERGIATRDSLEQEARHLLKRTQDAIDAMVLEQCIESLIDLYTATRLTGEEIENYINLARKMERFQNLTKVVNTEGATSLKIKRALKEFCDIPEGTIFIPPNEAIGMRVALINHFISSQVPFISVAKNHITIRDVDELVDRSYWSRREPGRIGGKAAGMVVAYRVIVPRLTKRDEELERYVRIPESYYFNSGIFTDFIDYNKLYGLHSQKYKTRDAIEEEYRAVAGMFAKASFPPDVVDLFRDVLLKVGEHPLILRSSSLLEDNYGYAFSGKYDSVFLANQGSLEKRLEEFITGMKRVHMSTYGPAPIMYRRDHQLLDCDERMSVLVQKVTGRRFGDYFFPLAAGVAYSYNPYGWTRRIKREEGLVRLVVGLGTRAVSRVANDYPRMIALSHPTLRPEAEAAQIMKYSQRMVDVMNLRNGEVESIHFSDLSKTVHHPDWHLAVSMNQDGCLSAPIATSLGPDNAERCITFEKFLTRTPFVRLMKKILTALEDAYSTHLDIEFSWDNGILYLLQCRTFNFRETTERISFPKGVSDRHMLFTARDCLRSGMVRDLEYIVYVDPAAYRALARHEDKVEVGRVVGTLNKLLEGKRFALFGPGRWGSNDVNLGVKVGYEHINHALALGEIALQGSDSWMEVSHGTHFFNDLVEADVALAGIYPGQEGAFFRADLVTGMPNLLPTLLPEFEFLASVVYSIHVPSCYQGRLLHIYQDAGRQRSMGVLS